MNPARRLLAVVVLAGFCGAIQAAPPDWVKQAMIEDVSEWKSSGSVQLLESEDVKYLSTDRVRKTIRGVRRVLSEAGISEAVIRHSYNPDTQKVLSMRAWTIAANGKDNESYRSNDFSDVVAQYSNHFWNAERQLIFVGTGRVEIGGILAWELQVEAQRGIFDTNCSFISPIPVARSVFEVSPAPGHVLDWSSTSEHMVKPAPGPSPGSLRWEMKKIQPLGSKRPAGFIPNHLRVSVRCLPANTDPAAKPTWKSLASRTADIIEPQVVISPEVKAKAEEIVAGKTSRWDRIRALSEFVQGEISYLSITVEKDSLAGYRPHPPAEVLSHRYGDCKDKATLLVAMLRALGESGYVVLVHANNPKALLEEWPSAFFNHAIAGIAADKDTPAHWPKVDAGAAGELVMFDATDPYTPLGVLSLNDQAGLGLVVSRDKGYMIKLPSPKPEEVGCERKVEATVDSTGQLTAKVHESYRGGSGAGLQARRVNLQKERFAHSLRERLHDALPMLVDLKWNSAWNASTSEFRLDFTFTADRFTRRTGELWLLVPQVVPSDSRLPAWELANEGVSWMPAMHLAETTRLRLPKGFEPKSVPSDWQQDTGGITCHLKYRLEEGGVLVFERTFSRPANFYSATEYTALRKAMQKLNEAERRPLILQRSPAGPVEGP